MIIETVNEFEKFISNIGTDDLFIHVVLNDDKLHPVQNKVCLVFIKHLRMEQTYSMSINHPDSDSSIELRKLFLKFIITSSNQKWTLDKKLILNTLNCKNLNDINLRTYLDSNSTISTADYSTSAHDFIYRTCFNISNLNISIPMLKHLELFEKIYDSVKNIPRTLDAAYDKLNNVIIPTLGWLEKNGINIIKNGNNTLVYSSYNIYHLSGRPSNTFGGINFSALNKSDDTRKQFTSRFGKDGKLLLLDYKSYHPHLLANLIGFEFPIPDAYEYLATLFLNKAYEELTDTDVSYVKNLTFEYLYGGIPEKYLHIKFLKSAQEYIVKLRKQLDTLGYVETPLFSRRIYSKYLGKTTDERLLNYILQSYETERNIEIIKQSLLYSINKKIYPILYQYDSLLFDIHISEMVHIDDVVSIFSSDKFPASIKIGDNYKNMNIYTLS